MANFYNVLPVEQKEPARSTLPQINEDTEECILIRNLASCRPANANSCSSCRGIISYGVDPYIEINVGNSTKHNVKVCLHFRCAPILIRKVIGICKSKRSFAICRGTEEDDDVETEFALLRT